MSLRFEFIILMLICFDFQNKKKTYKIINKHEIQKARKHKNKFCLANQKEVERESKISFYVYNFAFYFNIKTFNGKY